MLITHPFPAIGLNAGRPPARPGQPTRAPQGNPLFAGRKEDIAAAEQHCQAIGLDTVAIKKASEPARRPLSAESALLVKHDDLKIRKKEQNRLAQAYLRDKQRSYLGALRDALKNAIRVGPQHSQPEQPEAAVQDDDIDAEFEWDDEYWAQQNQELAQQLAAPHETARKPHSPLAGHQESRREGGPEGAHPSHRKEASPFRLNEGEPVARHATPPRLSPAAPQFQHPHPFFLDAGLDDNDFSPNEEPGLLGDALLYSLLEHHLADGPEFMP